TRPWSTAPSASAGMPGSPITCRSSNLRHRGHDPAAERGGPPAAAPPAPSWPQALRAIRAWLSPSIALQRWWRAWSRAPPPAQLQALMNSVAAGCGLHLYLPLAELSNNAATAQNAPLGHPRAEEIACAEADHIGAWPRAVIATPDPVPDMVTSIPGFVEATSPNSPGSARSIATSARRPPPQRQRNRQVADDLPLGCAPHGAPAIVPAPPPGPGQARDPQRPGQQQATCLRDDSGAISGHHDLAAGGE